MQIKASLLLNNNYPLLPFYIDNNIGDFHGYPRGNCRTLFNPTFILKGMTDGVEMGAESEAEGRAGAGLTHEACRGFPLTVFSLFYSN